jgi:hypothetical protein
VKVKRGQYPFAKHQVWAEVNVQHASELMRSFYGQSVNKASTQNDWLEFSAIEIGRRYKNQLSKKFF